MCYTIDNVSYAREIFLENRQIRNVGEHVIKKDALETILGLICVGTIPELASMKIEYNKSNEPVAEIIIPAMDDLLFYKLIYEKKLSSYAILKNIKFKKINGKIKISNIDICKILMILSSGTCYSNIDDEGDDFRLSYLLKRKEG
jgi:hypothetical protein